MQPKSPYPEPQAQEAHALARATYPDLPRAASPANPPDEAPLARPALPLSPARLRLRQAAEKAWSVGRRLIDGLDAHGAFEASASIAFWFFLSLVPLLVFVGWLLGHFARIGGVDALLQPALDVAPGSTDMLLRAELDRMALTTSAPIAPLSIVGFLWTSSSGLHNLMHVFETAVRAAKRPWWKQRLIALAWVIVALGAAVGTVWCLLTIDRSVHANDSAVTTIAAPMASLTRAAGSAMLPSAPSLPEAPSKVNRPAPKREGGGRGLHLRNPMPLLLQAPWEKLLAVVTMLLVGTTILAGIYRFSIEHARDVKRRYWPGAFTAVLCWLTVSWAFGEYVSSLANYAVYYGSLAAVAVLLVWLYLTSLTLVIGAEVNAQLEGVRK